jgi:hypothetical protein
LHDQFAKLQIAAQALVCTKYIQLQETAVVLEVAMKKPAFMSGMNRIVRGVNVQGK